MTVLNGWDTDTYLTEQIIIDAVVDGKANFGLYTKNLRGAQGASQIALCKKHGAKVWFIYEGMGDEATMELGEPRGQIDGAGAKAIVDALGAPASITIFAAVDFSAVGSSEIADVDAYMIGFQVGCAPYLQGDYGDGAVVLSLPNRPGYVAGAMGWSEVAQVQANPSAYPNVKILQHEETTAYGIGVDRCTILDASVLWDCGAGATVQQPVDEPAPKSPTTPSAGTVTITLPTDPATLQTLVGTPSDGILGPNSVMAVGRYVLAQLGHAV